MVLTTTLVTITKTRPRDSKETLDALQPTTITPRGGPLTTSVYALDITTLTETLVHTFTSVIHISSTTDEDQIHTVTSDIHRSSTTDQTMVHTITSIIHSSSTTAVPPQTSSPAPIGFLETTPHRFPTALVAVLLSLLSMFIIGAMIIYLRHRGPWSRSPSDSSNFVWGPLGLIKKKDAGKKQGAHGEKAVDPIAEAIRKEEQDRLRKQKRSGVAAFYAPQVRHLVDLLGSQEELRVNVKTDRSRKWPGHP